MKTLYFILIPSEDPTYHYSGLVTTENETIAVEIANKYMSMIIPTFYSFN